MDPLVGIQRAHIELYIRHLGEDGLQVFGQHEDARSARLHPVCPHRRPHPRIPADPAVYARPPKVHPDESRTQGLDRLELIQFLQVAQTLTVHQGVLAYLLGINALRASEAAAVRIEDYQETRCGYRVLRLVGKGAKPATMPLTVPVLRVLEACRGERFTGPLILSPTSGKLIDRRDAYRMVLRIAKIASIPRHVSPRSLRHAAITNVLDAGVPLCDAQLLTRHADPRTTENYDRAAATSTSTPSTSSPPTSQESDRRVHAGRKGRLSKMWHPDWGNKGSASGQVDSQASVCRWLSRSARDCSLAVVGAHSPQRVRWASNRRWR